ncbi:hypothetical protein HNO51_04010 [Billgrantia sulfidoxydans]|uniref:Pilus formation protein N-terminal domain-containing protein n=1 Tax=Billgrantia sulfidoxydans TaxID=2733484 RepID=A0ABX7W4J9_9GAMM|nr:pilus assembly protein N-terminal domain-containing protein [Halomonas sulfidoxydans]QTP53923.1 hypothetical protein HNO51_04010 [Halomonas sulfidoxydans]
MAARPSILPPSFGPVRFRYLACCLTTLLSWLVLAASAYAQNVDPGGEQGLTLETGQGRILRFGEPAESVFVADPEIADVQIVSPGVIYLLGPGRYPT